MRLSSLTLSSLAVASLALGCAADDGGDPYAAGASTGYYGGGGGTTGGGATTGNPVGTGAGTANVAQPPAGVAGTTNPTLPPVGTATPNAGGAAPVGPAGGTTGVPTQPTAGAPTQPVAGGGGTPAVPTAGTGGTTEPTTPGDPVEPGEIDCTSISGSGIPINSTGWIDASCNGIGLQGAWYCFDDGVATSSCVADTPPWEEGKGMCQSGESMLDATYAAWGAGIGLSLNETGGDDSVKSAYNATSNGVTGFRITLEGDSLGRDMRIGYSTKADPGDDLTPFVEVGELDGSAVVDVVIGDAVVPEAWEDVPNAGEYADPSGIFDMQIQFPGGDVAGNYSFCVTKVEPITDGSVPTADCSFGGAQPAGSTSGGLGADKISVGEYVVQNNMWSISSGQSVTAYAVSGGVGFSVNANFDVLSDAQGRPGAYGSAIYGWHHDGNFHGGFTAPRGLSSIGSMPSHFEVCTPSAGNWNASYDLWFAAPGGSPDDSNGTEFMIWPAYRDATPIGTEVGTESVNGASWEVWVGDDAGAWQTITFRRITNNYVFDADLMEFIQAGESYADYSMGNDLWSVQAGFEIWSANNLTLNVGKFSVSVN